MLDVNPLLATVVINENDECWEPIGDGLYSKFDPMERSKNKRTCCPVVCRGKRVRRELFGAVGAERAARELREAGMDVIVCGHQPPPNSPVA